MATKFTPGPWEVYPSSRGRYMVVADDWTDDGVLIVDNIHDASNATLIASAPSLYEKLSELLRAEAAYEALRTSASRGGPLLPGPTAAAHERLNAARDAARNLLGSVCLDEE